MRFKGEYSVSYGSLRLRVVDGSNRAELTDARWER